MSDLISRQTAIDALYKMLHDCFWADDEELDAVITTLNDLPSAQPERKTGWWIYNDKINLPQCSECGMWIDVMQQSGKMNFCPNCGSYNGDRA